MRREVNPRTKSQSSMVTDGFDLNMDKIKVFEQYQPFEHIAKREEKTIHMIGRDTDNTQYQTQTRTDKQDKTKVSFIHTSRQKMKAAVFRFI